MYIVPPITITDAMLNSHTVAEPSAGETLWTSGGTYTAGQVCLLATTHELYECVLGVSGSAVAPNADPTHWLKTGPGNRWAMFDTLRSTQTVGASPMVIVITPGQRIDSLAILGAVADEAAISVSVGGSVVYTASKPLLTRQVRSWYQWLTTPFRNLPSWAVHDIPPVTGATVTLTLTRATGDVKIGDLIVGRKEYAGKVVQDAEDDALNFSTIERSAIDGTATLTPRPSKPKTSQTTVLMKPLVPRLREVRRALDAVPALYSGMDDKTDDDYYESLLIKGIYKRFTITLRNPSHATVALDLEEV